MMNRLLITIAGLFVALSLNGCVGVVQDAIDAADEKVRLKWAEEWKPALMAEVKNSLEEGREFAAEQMSVQLESYRAQTNGKIESLGVKVEDFDTNKDGQVSGVESLALLQEIKAKNEEQGNPLEWWEIAAALAMAYVPMTAGKEVLKAKVMGTGKG